MMELNSNDEEHDELLEDITENGKRSLILKDMNLSRKDIPVHKICSYPLGFQLHKLSLSGNKLISLPEKLTVELTGLITLDLSQCMLKTLPSKWNLPNLKILNLSHNHIQEFFDENALLGIPKLEDLNLFDNQIHSLLLPEGDVLEHLITLNLDFNNLVELPEDMTRLKSLKTFQVSNNLITNIPRFICDMSLMELVVTPNPIIQPPLEDCERGIHGIRRYYSEMIKQTTETDTYELSKPLYADERDCKSETESYVRQMMDLVFKKPQIPGSYICHSFGSESYGRYWSRYWSRYWFRSRAKRTRRFRRERKKYQQELENNDLSRHKLKPPVERTFIPQSISESAQDSVQTSSKDIVNDTLKIIFVGNAYVGKTTIIKRLKEGRNITLPNVQERTIGVNTYEWNPGEECANYDIATSNFDTQVVQENERSSAPVDVKFSIWDFAGQNEYLASHEIFFSSRALYVLVWDMAVKDEDVMVHKKASFEDDDGPFRLDDSSSEEEDLLYPPETQSRKARRALDRDIDEKVQFWVNCIQSCVPGAVILPVASHADLHGDEETKRRCERLYDRLIQNENSRIEGIKERLKQMESDHRANSCEANRLRQLLSPYHRPKLIFGDRNDTDCVMRVSGKDYRGIDNLRAKIINLATGSEIPPNRTYPLFRGHLGSPIPEIRLRIREIVRETRENFHVISYAHFLHLLEEKLDIKKDDYIGHIFDALQFLTSIGELSYFGECHTFENEIVDGRELHIPVVSWSFTTRESVVKVSGLSQFIFLNPKWLAFVIGCILRHDLTEEIKLTRDLIRRKEESPWQYVGRGGSNFHAANKNVPIITIDDARMLWKAKKRIFRAVEWAKNEAPLSPYDFLINLLVHFNILVPIDLKMDIATFAGYDYTDYNFAISAQNGGQDSSEKSTPLPIEPNQPSFFLVPSLQGQAKPPKSIWTYKCNEAWKICLCHSWYFPDYVPPGLMDRVTASILRKIYNGALATSSTEPGNTLQFLRFRGIFSWRTALKLSLVKLAHEDDNDSSEEVRIEIWIHLVEKDSDKCVAADVMSVGTRRLIVSARGPEGSFCKHIWKGGFSLVLETVDQIMTEYTGLEYQRQYVCPQCLSSVNVNQAKVWNEKDILDAELECNGSIFCSMGHQNDIQTVDMSVTYSTESTHDSLCDNGKKLPAAVPFSELLNAVVLVGLWDNEKNCLVRSGTGFVVDLKRGLIVTAAHVVVDMTNESGTFGTLHYGLKSPKIFIGVQVNNESDPQKRKSLVTPEASFRYIADLVATDVKNMDVCILRISQRLQNFVDGKEQLCDDQIITEPANKKHFKEDNLQRLKLVRKCEYEEWVRILGYSQGGEGLTNTPKLNRILEVVPGNVMKIHNARHILSENDLEENGFHPREEIVVNCPTIGGHSGGPCVNQLGQVIGILSRSDPVESHRCYLAPTKEIMKLVKATILWEDQLHLGKLLR